MARKKTQKKKEKKEEETQQPASFSSLVLMLATGALQHLGVVENPLTKKKEKNLAMAKLTIDILGILRDKTNGNLEREEEKLLEELIYDLKMNYVKETGV